MPYCTVLLESFTMITREELINIVSVMNKTTCLSDPFPSKSLMSHLPTIIDTIMHMINQEPWSRSTSNFYHILKHIADNHLIDKFQSVYRFGHSTETALLRVYSDIATMVGKGNGSYLVLLDLSAAFDTIDHYTLLVILDKYIEITGSAIQILKSYFSD